MNFKHFTFLRISLVFAVIVLAAPGAGTPVAAANQPLSLHPENPHYFLFRGEPMIILTSGEHYGAVINSDFDFTKYLDTLARDGLNATRTWSGAYCEMPGAFNIAGNTLAPLPGHLVCPWARSGEPGYANGGNKFDLTRWDDAYFKRLRNFLTQAGERGIIVELNLFCPFYEDGMWRLSPLNSANNINHLGSISRTNVYTLDKNGGLLAVQEGMVRKLARELKDFDNLYYEICNEPYFGGVTLEWQHHIAGVIVQAEKELGVRHLISQNIANKMAKVENPDPAVSIFNFHYASPPDTVTMNYGLNKVIGDNETGFRGTNDAPYRMEAWDFIVAGGGLFNNLDYSFSAGHEDGSFIYPASQPGGGNSAFRAQIRCLRDLMRQFDFLHARPDNTVLSGTLPAGVTARALVKPGKEYLVYIRASADEKSASSNQTAFGDDELAVEVPLPPGRFTVEWFDTKTGVAIRQKQFSHSGIAVHLTAPKFENDIALLIRESPSAK